MDSSSNSPFFTFSLSHACAQIFQCLNHLCFFPTCKLPYRTAGKAKKNKVRKLPPARLLLTLTETVVGVE